MTSVADPRAYRLRRDPSPVPEQPSGPQPYPGAGQHDSTQSYDVAGPYEGAGAYERAAAYADRQQHDGAATAVPAAVPPSSSQQHPDGLPRRDPQQVLQAALQAEERRQLAQFQQQHAQGEQSKLLLWQRGDLQWQVFHRAWELSVNHSLKAWKMRFSQPIAPYALALLFYQPLADASAATARTIEVKAATKLWLTGPDPADPADLLAAAVDLVRDREHDRDHPQPWDVRTAYANRCDDGMQEQAIYLGLAMSNLDTRTGTFAQACRDATSELGIPGTILYTSADPESQLLLADRRGAKERNRVSIRSHRALSTDQLTSPYPYLGTHPSWFDQQSGYGNLLAWMQHLDHEIRAADQARRAFAVLAPPDAPAHRAADNPRPDTRHDTRRRPR